MRYFIFCALTVLMAIPTDAQSPEIDSLKEQLKIHSKPDTNRLRVFSQLVSRIRRVDLNEGLKYAEEGLAISEEIANEKFSCILNNEKTFILLVKGESEKAMEYALKTVEICGSCGQLGKQATAYFLASNLQLTLGNNDKAKEYANLSIEISNEINNTQGKILGYKAIGDILETEGNLQDALTNYEAGMQIAIEANNTTQQMVLSNNIGIIYDGLGWRDKALQYYKSAADVARKKNEMNGLINFYANIADIHGTQNESQKALEISLEALEIAKSTSNQRALPSLYSQIAKFYGDLGEIEKLEEYHLLSKEISAELNNKRALSFALDNLGKVAERKGQFAEAEKLYKECLAIREEINYRGGLTRIYNSLGYFYLDQNKVQSAIAHFLQAKTISEEMNFVEQMNRNYQGLAKAYAKKENYAEAFKYQKLQMATRDTLLNEDRTKQLTKTEIQFDVHRKENEIAQLESQASLQAAAREKDQWIKYLLLAGAALLAGLVYLFFNRAKVLRGKNNVIEKTSQELTASLTEKETLLKEIHHRVKNNLQIISSLLNLQTRQITDDQTLATIKEGQSRVQAMSLIHQKLYQSDRLSKVDIENYLEELTANLSQMFQNEGQEIAVNVDASNIEFDIDTAIPLGLIVNELVSNAYKYAFEGKTTGEINIVIEALDDIEYQLTVADDGRGLPAQFDPSKNRSLGLRLVNILSEQLRGQVESETDNGANFKVRFKDVRAFQTAA